MRWNELGSRQRWITDGSRVAITGLLAVLVSGTAWAGPITPFTAAGSSDKIQETVDAFRTVLGDDNGGGPCQPGPCTAGRREVNWDGGGPTPPDPFPDDRFNQATAPLARGLTTTTDGTGFRVSTDEGFGAFLFEDINPVYSELFGAFSPQKIFAPIDSNVTDVFFSVPGVPDQQATTNGFGAVFTSVNVEGATTMAFYDISDALLYNLTVPTDKAFSFGGAIFDTPSLHRVRITTGTHALGPSDGFFDDLGLVDVVAMDDFIYGEPIAAQVPEPTALLLFGTGLLGVVWTARRRGVAS